MKILVTGGTGFTGSALVKRLISRGNEVTVLDNQRGIMLDSLEALGARGSAVSGGAAVRGGATVASRSSRAKCLRTIGGIL